MTMPQFSRRDLTLLIIEDEEAVARYLVTVLRNLFKNIEVCATYADGEARVYANHVDAVLLDLNLTNGRGLVPIQKLREAFPYLPIIAMTGGDVTADEAMACGACDFLHKSEMSAHQVFDAVVKSVARRETFRKTAPLREAAQELDNAIREGRAKLQEAKGGVK
jgi:DNA-binding NtrC family response regulator